MSPPGVGGRCAWRHRPVRGRDTAPPAAALGSRHAEPTPPAAGVRRAAGAPLARPGRRADRAGTGRAVAAGARPQPADPAGARLRPPVLGRDRGAAGRASRSTSSRRATSSRERTLFHVHGGAFMSPVDAFSVRFVARLARRLQARVVVADYPLAPGHTWRDSFAAMADLAARWAGESRTSLVGDSAGGGYALALALALRDRGGPQPSELLLLSPWADLTTSTPETAAFAERRPVAVPRQAARLRALVGRLRGRPRPARGEPGARRPHRAAARR